MTKEICVVVSSKRQDALETIKPRFWFWFEDEPQFASSDYRGRFAARLLSYRRDKRSYKVTRLGLHDYAIRLRGQENGPVARICAR